MIAVPRGRLMAPNSRGFQMPAVSINSCSAIRWVSRRHVQLHFHQRHFSPRLPGRLMVRKFCFKIIIENLWMIEVTSGKATKIDTDNYPDPFRSFDATWAPDSKWVAYSKNLPSRLRAIFIYSLAEKKSHQITDGLADSISPAFDAGGKYLYFMASTNYGPSTGWLEMSSIDRPVRRAIYLTVLGATEPSPLLPETGDEPPPRPTPAEAATGGAVACSTSKRECSH